MLACCSHQIETSLVVEHPAVPRQQCPWVPGRDVWYGDVVSAQALTCEVHPRSSTLLHCK